MSRRPWDVAVAELRTQIAVDDLGLISQGPARKALLAWEGLMVVAAIATVVLFSAESAAAETAQWIIYGVFLLDYGGRLALAPDRRRFVRTNVLDAIALIPFDLFRAARAFRLIRLVRATVVVARALRTIRTILQVNHTGSTLVIAGLLIVFGGLGAALAEPDINGAWDGVWYAVVTTTTVGYGDYFPVTVAGRAIAVVLMFTGIGVVAAIGGAIATWAVQLAQAGPDTDPDHPDVAHTITRLTHWDELTVVERTRLADLLAGLARDPSTGPNLVEDHSPVGT